MSAPIQGLAAALADRYRLDRELGQGGMATVYLAHDMKHERQVAIKVLHPELAAVLGAERFLSEIRTTAKLQHPHILPLFDSGECAGLLYYVMPYVTGETLRDRLSRDQQLPIDEAVRLAREVAGALEHAHRQGVVHRDIKPENILLQDGNALVADFGIALAVQQAAGGRITQTGMSLGTPHYMAPEQAMGERSIGPRADIYALGVVTYEMLTGDPPFTGSTVQAIVAKVMAERPLPPSTVRDTVPRGLEHAVLKALAKLPADRWGSAAEFAAAMQVPGVPGERHVRTTLVPAAPVRAAGRERLAWMGLGALCAVAAGATWMRASRPSSAATEAVWSSILPPAGCEPASLAAGGVMQLSPDGRRLAFVASCGGDVSIWVYDFGAGSSRRLEHTDNATFPAWSPDGAHIAFFQHGRLSTVEVGSAVVTDLAAAPDPRGAAWGDGFIVYAPGAYGPLLRVPERGGAVDTLTGVPSADISHRLPLLLPGGRRLLFVELGRGNNLGTLLTRAIGGGQVDTVIAAGKLSNVAVAGNRLLVVEDGTLVSLPFDPASGRVTGPSEVVAADVEMLPTRAVAQYAVAGDRLVFRPARNDGLRMGWFDPRTGALVKVGEPGSYSGYLFDLSPDGRQLVTARGRVGAPQQGEVWLLDLPTGDWRRLSPASGGYWSGSWAPSGKFVSVWDGDTLRILSPDGAQLRAVGGIGSEAVWSWTPDGRTALGQRQSSGTGWDLVVTEVGDSLVERPLLATTANERYPILSPDGRLVAYGSTTSGTMELYVARFPRMDLVRQASTRGATCFMWSRDGRTLWFVDTDGQLNAVSVGGDELRTLSTPRQIARMPTGTIRIAAAPDGRLLLLYSEQSVQASVTLVQGWPALGGRR